ncbi:tryptophan synthase subunit alpha [Zooshikella marina]|uniref:Tryptophan synthase alpha chain n=1 Tax=Zooshikella ganghwensis TaxID=202772 RepID=A0A4P9VP25_9GAMM|nr:tryptophan synthase subunit alpha [Zooshikella ganghwensis]MBU2705272.1 tryptophan synthase subunit alpha [Zooshikella ganghwensis]RDH44419.1 tryptophan synthase subunit alpha [Zooshikella ganghwensis]
MSRIQDCFAALSATQRKALIPYITAGDSHPSLTVPLMHGLVKAGADIIELGVPFSDPMADGPVIQLACERALQHGINIRQVLAMVAEFRQTNQSTPVVLMGYLNPIENMGYEAFAQAAAEAGVDGVLTVDLPPEEADSLSTILNTHHIDSIFLLSPTTEEARIAQITKASSGYLYYVSLKGVTGAASLNVSEVAERLSLIRQHTTLPIAVGFGIKDGASAQAISALADGVVVGSALVAQIGAEQENQDVALAKVTAILAEMRHAMDS